MSETIHEIQIAARRRLVHWAHRDRFLKIPMQEWLENEAVLNYCKQHEIDIDILEHIAYWVWKPIKRH